MERNPKFITLLYFLLGDEFDSYMASQGTPIKISPLDILGFRRDHPDLFYEHLLNRKNHKPMKKYRVVTDNLDWVPIKRNDIITIESKFKGINFITEIKDSEGNILLEDCLLLMDKHPKWFEEIKEDKKESSYTEYDMIEFGEYVKNRRKFAYYDIPLADLLTLFKKRGMSKNNLSKEETKEFTRKDMCMFASYAHCYHSEKISYNAQLSEWESYYHNK